MTILAGFKCRDGVVVCADTQETVNQHSKRSVPKVRVEEGPYWMGDDGHVQRSDLAAAFCGAGEGPFIDKLIDRMWSDMRSAADLEEACAIAEDSIVGTYDKFGKVYQPGLCPHVELVYGVKMNGRSKLFTASGPVVNEKDEYASQGCGYYMVDFLASKMYQSYLTTRQCVILAAYILFQAKEHVDGCGGDSHIAVLREEESSGLVDYTLVKEVTEMLKYADLQTGQILLQTGDLNEEEETVNKEISTVIEDLKTMREHHRNKLVEHRDFMSLISFADIRYDNLGLPQVSPVTDMKFTPSDSKISEDRHPPYAEEARETGSSSSEN